MKLAAKISHLIWAGLWSSVLLWFSMQGLGGYTYKNAPYLLAIPAFSLAWLAFAVALLFNRRWAFYGSFLLAVLSLFVAYYLAWISVAMALHNPRTSFVMETVGAVAATIVVWLLLQSRHHFLSRHDDVA
jgi:hypothetical protein